MHKAIGLITCASVMAVSLYLFSGGDPSRTLSAQQETAGGQAYSTAARRFLTEAQTAYRQGDAAQARSLAETAAALPGDWAPGEQTPGDFLKSLNSGSPAGSTARQNPFGELPEWADADAASAEANPFGEASAEEAATLEQAAE